MKLKLDYDKATGLYEIMRYMLERYMPENIAESLVSDLVLKTFYKIRKKLEEPATKNYSLKLTPEEAKAYWIFFNQNEPETGFHYERNIVRAHCDLIDKNYGQRTYSAIAVGNPGVRRLD